jgi:hypothetical protein
MVVTLLFPHDFALLLDTLQIVRMQAEQVCEWSAAAAAGAAAGLPYDVVEFNPAQPVDTDTILYAGTMAKYR